GSDRRSPPAGQSDRGIVTATETAAKPSEMPAQPGRDAPAVRTRRSLADAAGRNRDDQAMDVRTTSSTASADLPKGTLVPIDPEDFRAVLSILSSRLSRPLVSLKPRLALLLGDSASGFTANQRDHLQTMVSLCDDLLRMARSYLDYAGIVQGSRPVCLGSFTIGALIQEIARQF